MSDQEILDGLRLTDDSPTWRALMAFLAERRDTAAEMAASSAPQHAAMAREFNAGRLNMVMHLMDELESYRRRAFENKPGEK